MLGEVDREPELMIALDKCLVRAAADKTRSASI